MHCEIPPRNANHLGGGFREVELPWVFLWMCVGGAERKGKAKEGARKEQRGYDVVFLMFFFYYYFFFFSILSRCELALVVLQADTTCAHAISTGLAVQAY